MTLKVFPIFGIPLVKRQIIATASLASLATCMVVLRFVTRCFRRQKVWWDDFWILLALIFLYIMQAFQIAFARYGIRHPGYEIPIENGVLLGKHILMDQFVYYCCVAMTKQSYLCFYSRIFPQTQFRRWVICCSVITWLWWVASIMQAFLICRPVQANWDATVTQRVCGDVIAAYIALGVIHLVTDLLIVLLPVPFVRKLQMDASTKVGLYVMFAMGGAVTVMTIIRIVAQARINLWNISYSVDDALFWSTVEPAVAIVNACIPAIRPLLSLVISRIPSSINILSSSQKRVDGTSSGATPHDPALVPRSSSRALGSSSTAVVFPQWFGQSCCHKSNASTRGFERMPSVGPHDQGEQLQLEHMENGTAGIGVALGEDEDDALGGAPPAGAVTHSKTVARAYAREREDSVGENVDGDGDGGHSRPVSVDGAPSPDPDRINVVTEVNVSNHRLHSAGSLLG